MKATRLTEGEAGFQRAVIDCARLMGWRFVHHRPARTAKGWRTAGSGDIAGWVDLVLWHERARRVLYVELKAERGRTSPAQRDVLSSLRRAGCEVAVWAPRDWDELQATLRDVA